MALGIGDFEGDGIADFVGRGDIVGTGIIIIVIVFLLSINVAVSIFKEKIDTVLMNV